MSQSVHYTFRSHVTVHTHTLHRSRGVFTKPFDHTWPWRRLPSYPEADNTCHVQVSINRTFDGGCWEIQGRGVHAGKPGVSNGGGGGVWSSLGVEEKSGGLDGVGETFRGSVFIEADASPHWSHRNTLAAVSRERRKYIWLLLEADLFRESDGIN